MADLTLPVQVGNLPSGFCPSTYQEMANGFGAVMSVILAQGTGVQIVASSTKPSDTTAVWLQLDSLGRPVRFYYFASGAWLSMHPMVPGATILWTTTLPDFTTFDGGDANPLSAISGPMWEEVTALRAAFPIGVGTLPSGTVVAVGGTGGEEEVTLVRANLPSADLSVVTPVFKLKTGGDTGGGGQDIWTRNEGSTHTPETEEMGDDEPHNNMPPYVGVYFLRRTARLYYTVT